MGTRKEPEIGKNTVFPEKRLVWIPKKSLKYETYCISGEEVGLDTQKVPECILFHADRAAKTLIFTLTCICKGF